MRTSSRPPGAASVLRPLALAVVMFLTACRTTDPTESQVAEATRLAMECMQQIGSINATSLDPDDNTLAVQDVGTFSASERPDLRHLTKDQLDSMTRTSEACLRRTFTGEPLTHFLQVAASYPRAYEAFTLPDGSPGSPSQDRTANRGYEFTGGVEDFEVDSLSRSGAGADITGSAILWVNGAMVEPATTRVDRVSGQVTFVAHLVLVDGTWKVDSYRDESLPGSMP